MNKESAICLIGMILPISFGIIIYLLSGDRTYVSDLANKAGISLPVTDVPQVIRNFGCDYLWGFALYSGLRLIADKADHYAKCALSALIISSIMESIQLFNSVPGVFDPLDLLIETIAVMTAMFISTIPGRLEKNEEKN